MRDLVRLSVLGALAMSGGFIWTAGQSGLFETNQHLCELWASLSLPTYPSCAFQNVLVYGWMAVAALCAAWIVIEITLWIRRRLLGRSLIHSGHAAKEDTIGEERETTASEKQRRFELIRNARQFVVNVCKDEVCDTDFKGAAERYVPYFELRPYMSEEFQRKMAASRTVFVTRGGSHLPALATWFLEELDRLEREWNLR